MVDFWGFCDVLSWLSADECFELVRNTVHRCHCDRDSCHLHSFTFLECASFSHTKVYMHTIDDSVYSVSGEAFIFSRRGLAKRQTVAYTSCVEHLYLET